MTTTTDPFATKWWTLSSSPPQTKTVFSPELGHYRSSWVDMRCQKTWSSTIPLATVGCQRTRRWRLERDLWCVYGSLGWLSMLESSGNAQHATHKRLTHSLSHTLVRQYTSSSSMLESSGNAHKTHKTHTHSFSCSWINFRSSTTSLIVFPLDIS